MGMMMMMVVVVMVMVMITFWTITSGVHPSKGLTWLKPCTNQVVHGNIIKYFGHMADRYIIGVLLVCM